MLGEIQINTITLQFLGKKLHSLHNEHQYIITEYY
jgi:hypothetical protein